MKFKSFLVYFALFIGIFSFSMAGYLHGESRTSEKNAPDYVAQLKKSNTNSALSANNATAENLVEKVKETYILRENSNKISLFIRYYNGDEQIHSEYDVAVNLLPKSDRERLGSGIEFDSMKEAIMFVEDYMG